MDRYEKTDWIPNVTLVAAENLNRIEDKVEELTNFQIEKESNISDALSELEEAKKDFNGVERASLSERLTTDISYINDRFNNSSLIAYEDKYISANNTYDGVTKDLKIKGKTLQNLCTGIVNYSSSNNNDFTITETEDYIKVVKKNNNEITWNYAYAKIKNISIIKPNTKYTFFIRLSKRNNGSINFLNGDATNNMTGSIQHSSYKNEILKAVILTKSSFSDISVDKQLVYLGMSKTFLSKENDEFIIYKNPILLEGDYSNEDIQFFQDIQSVGEEGKIDLISCGKNLCPYFETGTLDYVTGQEKNNDSDVRSPFIVINKNTNYGSFNGGKERNTHVFYYDHNKKYILKETLPRVTSLNNSKYCRLGGASYDRDKFIFTQNLSSLTYEPYKESRIFIDLKEPLRSLPNGVYDEIDLERSKIIRRVGKVILNGTEKDLNLNATGTYHNQFVIHNILKTANKGNHCELICDTKPLQVNNGGNNSVWIYAGGTIVFQMNENYNSVASFRDWLSKNNTTIYYELAIPIEEDIQLPKTLRTYDTSTNIFTDGSLIEPIISCKIPSNVEPVVTTLNSSNNELNEKIQILNEENNNIRKINQENSEAINIIDSIIKTL